MAQIEIMSLDLPRVEYIHENEKGKNQNPTRPIKINPNDASVKLQEEANKRAVERRKKNEWQKIKLSELDTNTQTNTDTHG